MQNGRRNLPLNSFMFAVRPVQRGHSENTSFKGVGQFHCSCCGNPLFGPKLSLSGTGWPSFYQPISEERSTILKTMRF